MSKLFVCLVITAFLYQNTNAQNLTTPAPSSHQTIKQELGLSTVELTYSRPNVKGRKIFGDLVPYGKVWRTGANQATTLTFGDAVTIGGTKIPAGKYGLLSIPGADEWTLIISKQLDVTNPAAYKADQDVVRVQVKPFQLPFPLETFSMLFANVTANSCELQLIWENTVIALPITTDIDTKVMAQIDRVMTRDNRPYFEAGVYYLDNGKDLNKALEWFDKAIAQDPSAGGSFFVYYQKARCQAKMGRKADAKTTAQKGIEMAKQANNADYVALNEKLIATL
jgi:tetratricopeptide (TPR) repeat protein